MTRKSRILLYSLFCFINFLILLFLILRENAYKLPFFLTLHSFWSNCFYFTTCLILEIRAEWKNIYSENFLPFMQNTYFKYSFTYTCFITVNFYLCVLLGSNFMKLPDSPVGLFFTVFLHGGEFVFVLIEFYITQHFFVPSYAKDIAVIKVYFTSYFFFSLLAMNSQIFAYEFMKITSTTQNIVIYVISFILLGNYYMFYQWLTHRKNMNVLNETISIRRINYVEDPNNNSVINAIDKEMNFIGDEINEKNKRSIATQKTNKDDFDNDKIKRNILNDY